MEENPIKKESKETIHPVRRPLRVRTFDKAEKETPIKRTEMTSRGPRTQGRRKISKPIVKGGIFNVTNQDLPQTIKKPKDDSAVYYAALGGLEEIGRNMAIFEYKDEIIAIDAGIQFPEEETPGVDYIIPNTTYLEMYKKSVKALIITHAHYDHIGAIPYIIDKIGNPPIYTTRLGREMIQKRQVEFINSPRLDIRVVSNGDKVRLSPNFEVEFFDVSHSIPDSTGLILKTPVGNMVTFGDFRIEYNGDGEPKNLNDIKFLNEKGVHTLLLDSTNAENPGKSLSEEVVIKNLEDIFRQAEGRIIVGVFSTLITRIGEIIKIAEKLNRKVVFSGRSVKDNSEIGKNLGYIKVKPDTVIAPEEMRKYRDNQLLVISTGAQGESNASLMKIVTGEHRMIRIKRGDSVIFSSSIIPGNERSVQVLKDNLVRQGAIIHHNKLVDIHATGHAPADEIKMVIQTVKPKYFIPVHGHLFHRHANKRNAMSVGMDEKNILIPDNGERVKMTPESISLPGENLPVSYVMVDGLGVGDVSEVVLRDRRLLASEGMITLIIPYLRKEMKLIKNPDVITKGFIMVKENPRLIEDIKIKTKGIISRLPKDMEYDGDYLKTMIRDQIGQFVYSKTNRRPMILPIIIEL